jgi:hypothetical protein
MMFSKLAVTASLLAVLSAGGAAQNNAASVLANASKAMDVDSLTSIESEDPGAMGDREVLRGSNGKMVEVHAIPNEHSDSLVMVYLPAEKVLWTADVTLAGMATPAQFGVTKAALATSDRLNLQWTSAIPAHSLNPERMVPKAETHALIAPATARNE